MTFLIHAQVEEESFYENTGIGNEATTVGIGEQLLVREDFHREKNVFKWALPRCPPRRATGNVVLFWMRDDDNAQKTSTLQSKYTQFSALTQ